MKIRSLELRDFRKFTGTFRVDGIADGLNVLVGPNEHGKSTLLAAINGVIFEKATSQNERVEGFRHFRNGAVPTVELTFELGDERWTIQKRFARQSGKTVLTNRNGGQFESETAEAQLQQLLDFERPSRNAEPGIWGTLWVQQGKSFGDANLDEFGRRSLEDCLEAQVGIVTGGLRGQRIPAAIEHALETMKSMRGPRGKFKEAVDQLAAAGQRMQEWEKKRDQLSAQTEELGRLRRDHQRARADWDEPAHQQSLNELRDSRTAAATKAAQTDAARGTAELAAEHARQAEKAVDERKALIDGLGALQLQAQKVAVELKPAQDRKCSLERQIEDLERQLAERREVLRQNTEKIRRLDRVRSVLSMTDEIRHHEDTLAKAAQLRGEIGQLIEQIAANPATDENVSRVQDASGESAAARAGVNAVATRVILALDPGAVSRVRLDGEALTTTSLTVTAVTRRTVAIDGIGDITVEPQIADREAIVERVRRGEADFAAALERAGAGSLSAARVARAKRQELVLLLESKQREIGALTPVDPGRKLPAGLEAREVRIRELHGKLNAEFASLGLASLPLADDAEAEISDAQREGEQLSAQIDGISSALGAPRLGLVEAAEAVRDLERELLGLTTRLEEKSDQLAAGRARCDDDELGERSREQGRLAEKASQALAAKERDQGEAVADIDLRIRRKQAEGQRCAEGIAELDKQILGLEKTIEANEGAGAEEELEIARADEDRWQRAVKDYEEDVKVLGLLRDTLRTAESEAKRLYLTPIAQRTEPYLRMLLPETRLKFSEKLGIEGVERRGAIEEFAYLSAGTQEQLAVLTRLAFAELLLDKGHPATVILDDALVFSDDDRIERMFDILVRAGEKVQILILTCRRRLFTRLGAPTLQLVECSEAT